MRVAYALLLAGLFLDAVLFAAYGHDASEADAEWFNSLHQPGTGIECCGSTHDCRAYDERTEVQITEGIYHVRHDGEWVEIPANRIIENVANPTGSFVACIHGHAGTTWVLCAVKGTGT